LILKIPRVVFEKNFSGADKKIILNVKISLIILDFSINYKSSLHLHARDKHTQPEISSHLS